ncbi:MAG: hypothetical protein EBS46_02025, partial [Proteobacteria bacterium]|nr:hypothetical protein [Candidatus Fonsibacter sp. PEL4]
GSGTLTLSGTIDGGQALTITNTGTVALNGNVGTGAGTALTSLSVSGPSSIGADIKTSGTQTYTGAVTVSGGNRTLTTTSSTAGDTIIFSSTVDSDVSAARALTITTGGNTPTVRFNGVVGGTNPLGAIAITGALDLNAIIQKTSDSSAGAASLTVSGVSDLGANVNTSGIQTYSGAVTLSGADRTLKGSTITNSSTITGATFSLTETGNSVINGAISGVNIFSVSGTTSLGADVSTTGTQTFTGALTVNGAARTLTTTGDDVTFSGTINSDSAGAGVRNLTIATGSAATVQFNGIVGGTYALGAIAITGTSAALDLNAAITGALSLSVSGPSNLGANVTTTANSQTYTGAVTLSVDTTLTDAGNILFSSTVDGGYTLTIVNTASGNITFTGAVGGTTPLTGLDITTNTLTAAAIKSTGTLSVNNALASSITGIISDGSTALAVTKSGVGPLTLSGANTYTGGTTITNGVVKAGISSTGSVTNGAFGTGSVTVNSAGAIDLNSYTVANALSLSGTGYSSSGALYNSHLTSGATASGNITLAGATILL